MKTKNTFFLGAQLLCLFVIFSSCSSSKDESTTPVLPQITTNNAENIVATRVTLGGTITSNGNTEILKYGICWGLADNPTIGTNNYREQYNNIVGSFSIDVAYELEQNKLYYVRAYCENSVGLQYGNTVSFTTAEIISILNPTNILTTKVQFRGSISQASNDTSTVGFVYSTLPNPTANDIVTSTSILGSDQFELDVQNLTKNTTYYVRAFYRDSGQRYYYSEEKQFKTVGYYGPAGGYVAYDKGEMVDGWRYLEVHPTTLSYNIASTTGSQWGTFGQFVSGTLPDFGKGLDNTTIIVNNTTQSNCAAKLCYNLVLNGFSDWFLASSDEMLLISNSLALGNINFDGHAWTSTQDGTDFAYATSYDIPTHAFVIFGYVKSNSNLNVFPVRRY